MNDIIKSKKNLNDKSINFIKIHLIIRFILGLIIWFSFIFKYLIEFLKKYKFIDSIFLKEELITLIKYRYLIYFLIIILSAFIFRKESKITFILSYVWYLITFPLIIIFRILFKFVPAFIRRCNLIYESLKKLKKLQIQFCLLLLDALCCYLIIKFQYIWIIYIAMLFLIFLLIAHLYFLYFLMMNPLTLVNKFYLTITVNFWEYIKKTTFSKKEKSKESEKENDTLRTNIKLYGKLFYWLSKKVETIFNKKSILQIFIFLFLFSLCFTIIIFSFEYYALTKINSNHLNIFGDNRYFSCLFYSISNLSTINSGDIFPQSSLSKLIVIAQIFFGIFIFYIFIISFTTFSSAIFKKASSSKRKILDKLNGIKDFLNSQSTKELNISLEKLIKEKMINLKHDNKN